MESIKLPLSEIDHERFELESNRSRVLTSEQKTSENEPGTMTILTGSPSSSPPLVADCRVGRRLWIVSKYPLLLYPSPKKARNHLTTGLTQFLTAVARRTIHSRFDSLPNRLVVVVGQRTIHSKVERICRFGNNDK